MDTPDRSDQAIAFSSAMQSGEVVVTINSLPTEILCEIFSPLSDIEEARDVLRLVCRFWRDIIDSTGYFWRKIKLSKTILFNLDVWQRRISRANVTPLDITWDWGWRDFTSFPSRRDTFLAQLKLMPFKRWGNVSLVHSGLSRRDLQALTLANGMGGFNNLTHLVIVANIENWGPFLEHVAKTAVRLISLNLAYRQRFPANFEPKTETAVQKLLSRVSSFECAALLPSSIIPSRTLPPNIVDVRIRELGDIRNFGNTTHLEIVHFRPRKARNCKFESVKVLSILEFHDRYFDPVVHFPNLWKLIVDTCSYSELRSIIAPRVRLIEFERWGYNPASGIFTPTIMSDYLQNLRPDSLYFKGEVDFGELMEIFRFFPHIKNLTASFDFPSAFLTELGRMSKLKEFLNRCPLTLELMCLYIPDTETENEPWWVTLVDKIFEARRPVLRSISFIWDSGKRISRSLDSLAAG